MYHQLKMVIFQPAMLVYWRVTASFPKIILRDIPKLGIFTPEIAPQQLNSSKKKKKYIYIYKVGPYHW